MIRRRPPHQRFVIRDDWTDDNSNRDMTYQWTGTTTFTLKTSMVMGDDVTMTPATTAPPPITTTEVEDQTDEGLPPVPETPATMPSVDMSGSEPLMEPDPPRLTTPHNDGSTTAPTTAAAPPLAPEVANLYQPQQPGESFEQFRSRYQQQETQYFRQPQQQQYGPAAPAAPQPNSRPAPYNAQHRPNTNTSNAEPDVAEVTYNAFEVDVLDGTTMPLPPGWMMEHGYLTLEEPSDEWSIKDGWLIRHHYVLFPGRPCLIPRPPPRPSVPYLCLTSPKTESPEPKARPYMTYGHDTAAKHTASTNIPGPAQPSSRYTKHTDNKHENISTTPATDIPPTHSLLQQQQQPESPCRR